MIFKVVFQIKNVFSYNAIEKENVKVNSFGSLGNIGYITKVFNDILHIAGLNYCKVGDLLTTFIKSKSIYCIIYIKKNVSYAIIIENRSQLNVGDLVVQIL